MLKDSDFECAVTKENVNGVKYWEYHGDSLKGAAGFAKIVRAAGEKFYDPLTNEVTGVHTAVLDKAMVTLLIAMSHYHRYNDHPSMSYPDDFPLLHDGRRGFTGEYAYLVHFGLLNREHKGEDTCYSLTKFGFKFVWGGAKICPVLYNSGSQIHGFDENFDRVDMKSFFSQEELDKMRKPLWFLPEKFRQQILVPMESTDEHRRSG